MPIVCIVVGRLNANSRSTRILHRFAEIGKIIHPIAHAMYISLSDDLLSTDLYYFV